MENKEIVSRWDALYNERQGTVDGLWDLVDRFVMPLRNDFYSTLTSEGEVDWRRRDLYDSTAVFGAQQLSAAIHSNLTSPAQRWFEYRFRDPTLNTDQTAKEWLDQCTTIVYEALNESNFDVEIVESYTDEVGYGTSALSLEQDEETGELVFSANPLRDVVFELDHRKQARRIYKRLQWTAGQIVSKFGDDTPDWIKKREEESPGATDKIDLIFCVYPREGKEADPTLPTAPKERPFGYKWVVKNTAELLGEEGGYYEMSMFITRWRSVAGSRWGKSPSTDAMGDIMTLNQLKEAILEAAGKAIDPPQKAEDGAIVGDLDMDRGGLTILTDINGLSPMDAGTDFNVAGMEVADLRDSIRDHYYQNQLQLKESPAMTATEVSVRYELMQRLMGPTLGRQKSDKLDKILVRAFGLLYRAGRLPPVPEGLAASELDIQYTGPLPRAQHGNAAQATLTWMGDIAQLAEVYPEARDLPDVEEAMRMIAEMRGVPAKAIRSQQELDVMRAQQKQQQQAAQMAQMAQGAGEAMKSVGEGAQALMPPEEGAAAA